MLYLYKSDKTQLYTKCPHYENCYEMSCFGMTRCVKKHVTKMLYNENTTKIAIKMLYFGVCETKNVLYNVCVTKMRQKCYKMSRFGMTRCGKQKYVNENVCV